MRKTKTRSINRREFNQESLVALFSGVAITISGCGGGGGGSPAAPTAAANPTPTPTDTVSGRQGSISANHGHVAILTSTEFTATGGVMLNIQGQADHTHMLELTEAELDAIENGQTVSKITTTGQAHNHTVTFAATNPMPDDY